MKMKTGSIKYVVFEIAGEDILPQSY